MTMPYGMILPSVSKRIWGGNTMNPETRQTLIGVVGVAFVVGMALHEGINGKVTMMGIVAVVALIAPEALKSINPWSSRSD